MDFEAISKLTPDPKLIHEGYDPKAFGPCTGTCFHFVVCVCGGGGCYDPVVLVLAIVATCWEGWGDATLIPATLLF